MPLIVYDPPGHSRGAPTVPYVHFGRNDHIRIGEKLRKTIGDSWKRAQLSYDPDARRVYIKLMREGESKTVLLRRINRVKSGCGQFLLNCRGWREQFKLTKALRVPARFEAHYDESRRQIVVELTKPLPYHSPTIKDAAEYEGYAKARTSGGA